MSQALFCHMRLLSSDSPRPAWNASWIKSSSPKPLDDLLWKGVPQGDRVKSQWHIGKKMTKAAASIMDVSSSYNDMATPSSPKQRSPVVPVWSPERLMWTQQDLHLFIQEFSKHGILNLLDSLTSQYLPPFSLKLWCLSRFILWFWVSGNQSVGIQWSCLMHMKCPWPRMGTSHTSLVSSGQKWQDCSFHWFLPGFYIDGLVSSMEVRWANDVRSSTCQDPLKPLRSLHEPAYVCMSVHVDFWLLS